MSSIPCVTPILGAVLLVGGAYLLGGLTFIQKRVRAAIIAETRGIVKAVLADEEIRAQLDDTLLSNMVAAGVPATLSILRSEEVARQARQVLRAEAVHVEACSLIGKVLVRVLADDRVFDALWQVGARAGKRVAGEEGAHAVAKDIIAKSVIIAMQDSVLKANVQEMMEAGLADEKLHAACIAGAYNSVRNAIKSALLDPELQSLTKDVLKSTLQDEDLHRATIQGALTAMRPAWMPIASLSSGKKEKAITDGTEGVESADGGLPLATRKGEELFGKVASVFQELVGATTPVKTASQPGSPRDSVKQPEPKAAAERGPLLCGDTSGIHDLNP